MLKGFSFFFFLLCIFGHVFQMLAHQIGSQAWSWSSWTSQEPFLTCVSSSRSVKSSTPYNSDVLNYTKNVCLHWENVPFIIFNSIQCYPGNVGKADWSSFNLTLLYLTDISEEECVFEPICSIVDIISLFIIRAGHIMMCCTAFWEHTHATGQMLVM